jgi:hypothetical protein
MDAKDKFFTAEVNEQVNIEFSAQKTENLKLETPAAIILFQ